MEGHVKSVDSHRLLNTTRQVKECESFSTFINTNDNGDNEKAQIVPNTKEEVFPTQEALNK